MDFSTWDWARSFRMHEAACLIAGVIPLSKIFPHPSELPLQARPVYRELVQAYVRWVVWMGTYEKRGFPVLPPDSTMLEGLTGPGIAHPRLPNPITTLPGEIIRRSELHRWVKAMGHPSAYHFQPHANAKAHEQALLQPQAESVQPAPMTHQVGLEQIGVMRHSSNPPKRDGLWVAIDEAKRRSTDPSNTSEVWVHMIDLANEEYPPLLMVVDQKIKHTGRATLFTRDALDKRLHPEKRKSPAKRR